MHPVEYAAAGLRIPDLGEEFYIPQVWTPERAVGEGFGEGCVGRWEVRGAEFVAILVQQRRGRTEHDRVAQERRRQTDGGDLGNDGGEEGALQLRAPPPPITLDANTALSDRRATGLWGVIAVGGEGATIAEEGAASPKLECTGDSAYGYQ